MVRIMTGPVIFDFRLFDLEMKDGDLGGENLLRQTAAGERKALLAVTTADL